MIWTHFLKKLLPVDDSDGGQHRVSPSNFLQISRIVVADETVARQVDVDEAVDDGDEGEGEDVLEERREDGVEDATFGILELGNWRQYWKTFFCCNIWHHPRPKCFISRSKWDTVWPDLAKFHHFAKIF